MNFAEFRPHTTEAAAPRQEAKRQRQEPTPKHPYRPGDASTIASIPAELRARLQWVLWRYGPPKPDGKRPKVPYNPRTLARADTTAPATWGSYEAAAAALASRPGYFDGLGYVFAEDDPYTGIDLDGCIADGAIAPWAQQLLDQLPPTYVELSPSGAGLHVFVRAQLPGAGRRRGPVECYDRARFFTITGRARSAPGAIADGQAAVAALYAQLGGRAAGDEAPRPALALDWSFVAWLEARPRRLLGLDGIPYGVTPQLRNLLLRDELPASLAAKGDSPSERRALVVRQLARAGHLPEEIYVISRLLWASRGYESKRPQDMLRDALRLLALAQIDPAKYSPHSLARFADYRRDPARPQEAAPDSPLAAPATRRAPCTPEAYLATLQALDTGCGVVLATRAERAAAAGVSVKTAQRLEARLVELNTITVELYTLSASDGRHTRASRITLRDHGDVHTGISTIGASSTDVHTGPAAATQRSSTGQSADGEAQAIGETQVVPPSPSPRPPVARLPHKTCVLPSPARRPLAELVAEALDAYGTAGGKAALRRVVAHVRTVGGLKTAEGAIKRVYDAELVRRRRARSDAAFRRRVEVMSPTKRRAKLKSLERSIMADLRLAAELRVRPHTLDGETRSPLTPEALTARAWVWARQYAIVAAIHEARQEEHLEEAQLLAEASAAIERLLGQGELVSHKPRASFAPVPNPAPGRNMPAAPAYDAAGLAGRLRKLALTS